MKKVVSSVVGLVFTFQVGHASNLECRFLYDANDLTVTTQLLAQPHESLKTGTLSGVQRSLGLDDINFKYLQVLFKSYSASKHTKQNSSVIVIADHNNLAEALGKPNMVVPTAIASAELMKSVPVTNYSSIAAKKAEFDSITPDIRFWVKKLMAGTGSGIVRTEFLKDIYQKLGKTGAVKVGSKGTDLHAELVIENKSYLLSIAELQILQLLVQSDKYKQVIFHDVVSNETQSSIEMTWTKSNPLFRGQSLADQAAVKGEVRLGPTVQYHIPTIAESGYLTRERSAPAGHGLFAIEAIDATLNNKLPITKKGESLIGVIGNGEDLMSTPSTEIVGWMAKERLPIVMVTTEKTDLDKQGGQIAIGFNSKAQPYVTIVEKAQAENAAKNGFPEQTDLFAKLGLRTDDRKAMFNTNMVIFNYNTLKPKLENLAEKVGGNDRLMELVAPDLIVNTKEQASADGVKKKFIQLEGAMGSVILKLDRLYRETFNGEALVHFLNIEKESRTQYFAPIKSAFDFFMQFYSDRFDVDGATFKIVDKRPGFNPKVTLTDDYYKEAANVLSAFKNTKILELDELTINGKVTVPGMKLSGIVRIKNLFPNSVNLPDALKAQGLNVTTLKNVEVMISEQGIVSVKSI